jgi:hypothetical protein
LQKGPVLREEGGVLFALCQLNIRLFKIAASTVGQSIRRQVTFADEPTKKRVMKNIRLSVLGMLASAFIMSGCGNVDIVKRRHMPGYHVEVTKKAKTPKSDSDELDMAAVKVEVESIDTREARLAAMELNQDALIASAVPSASEFARIERKAARKEAVDRAIEKTVTNFKHDLAETRNAFKPAANSNTHWMAWVAFGAGIGSAFFGFLGIILAFFGIGMWAAAITFGVAAIVFAILHSKNNYQGASFRRIGLILGIVGASLGIIGMLIWILRVAAVFVV